MVTYQYAYVTYIVSPLAGLGGGISWRPPAHSLFKMTCMLYVLCCGYCCAVASGFVKWRIINDFDDEDDVRE